jgi:hypothetical protein
MSFDAILRKGYRETQSLDLTLERPMIRSPHAVPAILKGFFDGAVAWAADK